MFTCSSLCPLLVPVKCCLFPPGCAVYLLQLSVVDLFWFGLFTFLSPLQLMLFYPLDLVFILPGLVMHVFQRVASTCSLLPSRVSRPLSGLCCRLGTVASFWDLLSFIFFLRCPAPCPFLFLESLLPPYHPLVAIVILNHHIALLAVVLNCFVIHANTPSCV